MYYNYELIYHACKKLGECNFASKHWNRNLRLKSIFQEFELRWNYGLKTRTGNKKKVQNPNTGYWSSHFFCSL